MKFLKWAGVVGSVAARGVRSVVIAAVSPIEFREILLFVGAGLLAVGVWPIYPPASFIIPGAILVYVSVFGTP